MTIEIDRDRKTRALNPPPAAGADALVQPERLVAGLWVFIVVAVIGGVVLTGADLATARLPAFRIFAATCFVLAGLAGAVLCIRALLADRQEFYRRGQLSGYMRCWRGQDPEVDDPLLRL